MPVILIGNPQGARRTKWGGKIEYEYPEGLDLSPHSKLHTDIVGRLMMYAEDSHSVMSRRHDQWTYIDEMMTAFIPLSDYEKNVKGSRGRDPHSQMHRHTKPVSIVVPYSYATYETVMTYFVQSLLQSPIFQYSGGGPGDFVGAKLLEIAVAAQTDRFAAELEIHTALSDGLKYGLGASTFEWKEHWGNRTVRSPMEEFDDLGRFMGTRAERPKEQVLRFEGNSILPIDPYRLLPDPNVSAHRIQDGEFYGWSSNTNYYDLLEQERNDENVFNAKYIGRDSSLRQYTSRFSPDASRREYRWGGGDNPKTNTTNYLSQVHMYVTLVPEEWGLPGDEKMNPEGDYPEKWLFTVTSDTLLTRAARHNLDHGLYPAATVAPDFDGYTCTPVGRLEMLHGLQDGLNWLYNSHVSNVRKAINDMLIVDPSLVVMEDLRHPEPGKLIRLRRSAWGRGTKDAVSQLGIVDVTRQNISDGTFLMDMMQRVSAAVDSVQGVVRAGGERRSAAEHKSAARSALSRLEHMARISSSMYLRPLSYMMASQTQQFMSQPVWAGLTADWQKQFSKIFGPEGMYITPEEIDIDYDVIIRDGSSPTGAGENADLLVQLYQVAASNPQIAQQMDMVKLFQRIAYMMGDKDIHSFVNNAGDVQAATASDGEVQRAVQQGNLVPVNSENMPQPQQGGGQPTGQPVAEAA